jgi:hypothetical protein
VIADVGRGRYTKAYFGPERYEHFVNSSLGHSVPVVNGQAQRNGREYAAMLLDHRADGDVDLMKIELKDAYPAEAGLAALQRTVALHREPPRGWVELVDEVRFAERAGSFESVLTTFGQAEMEAGAVRLRGERGALRVTFDPAVVTPRTEVVENVDLAEGPTNVRRIVFALSEPAQSGTVRLRIEPV